MQTSILNGRRSAIDILYDILAVCDNGGTNKTAIMYRGNLSYQQLQRYLTLLSERHLIAKNENGHFHTTPAGQETFKQVSKVRKSIRALRTSLDIDDTAAD